MAKRTRHSSITLPLALIVLIIIFSVGIGYILGEKAGKEQSRQVSYSALQSSSIAPATMPTEADKIVQDYYNWYVMCLNQHFTDNYDRSPQEDCPYNKKGILTKELVSKLQQAKDSDPVLCAQNTPEKITYENAIINPNGSATVVVHTHWGASPTHNVYIWVVGKKIADISCN